MSASVKLVFSLIMTSFMIIAYLTRDRWQPRLPRNWRILLIAAIIATRVIAFVFVFLILNRDVPGDTAGFWLSAERIHQGMIPFKDFSGYETPYNPGFYYILAIAESELHLQALLAVIEIISFIILLFILHRTLPEVHIQLWGMLYLFSPLTLWFATIGGQEDALILLFYSITLLFFLSKPDRTFSNIVGGIIAALGFLCTKALALVPLPLFLGIARKQSIAVISYGLVILLSIPLAIYLGPSWISSVLENSQRGSAPTVWMLAHGLTNGLVPATPSFATPLMLVTVWIVGLRLAILYRNRFANPIPRTQTVYFATSWVIIWTLFALMTSHGLAAYIVIWLPLVALLLAREPNSHWLLNAFIAVNVFANVQASMFYAAPRDYTRLDDPTILALIGMDCVILVSYAIFGLTAYKQFNAMGPIDADSSANQEKGIKTD